jgi:putative ABC transport system substrate-binding protein
MGAWARRDQQDAAGKGMQMTKPVLPGLRRRILGALGAAAMVSWVPSPARGSEGRGVRRIGVLIWGGNPMPEALVREHWANLMAARGHAAGRELDFEFRFSWNQQVAMLAPLATELVLARPDALLGLPVVSVKALSEATSTIPIVGLVGDPVMQGYSDAIGRPTRNVTGVADRAFEVIANMVELLQILMPRLVRFGIVGQTGFSDRREFHRLFGDVVRKAGLEPVSFFVSQAAELVRALQSMPRNGIGAAWHFHGNGFLDKESLAKLAQDSHVALVDAWQGIVPAGGLLSYSAEVGDRSTVMAGQLDRILRGTPVREVPFHLPTRFRLEINSKTATALGLAIPPELLLRADKVYN